MDVSRWLKHILAALVLCAFAVLRAFAVSDVAVPEVKDIDEEDAAGEVEKVVDESFLPIEKRMVKYEHFAQELRELSFKKPVQYRHLRKKEVKEILDKKLAEEYPEKVFDDKIEAYVKMGLLESSEGVRNMILEVMSEQVAGFYDPREHVLYTIGDLGLSEELDAMIYVHELTHALQDQHFSLEDLGIYDKQNDDKAIAALALVEGDATLIIGYYFATYGKLSFKMLAQAMMLDSSKLNAAPYALRRSLMFPYMDGMSFVTKLFAAKGWEGLNDAFEAPPQSSEQILHPEKYLGEIDEPTEVELPDVEEVLGSKWRLIDENVMGELNTQILLQRFLGKWRSQRPSRGWDGDRYEVFKNSEDGSILLVWSSVWDSEKDADEFFSAYVKLLPKKYSENEFDMVDGSAFSLWKSDGLSIFVGKTGEKALTIEAPDEDLLMKILGRFEAFRKLVLETSEEG